MKEKIKWLSILIAFIIILVASVILLNTRKNTNNKSNLLNEKEKTEEIAVEVNEGSFDSEVIKSDKKVIIDFYATWCGPCKILSPTLEEVARERKDIKLVKIDVDKNPRLATAYGIYAMPTLIIVEKGKEVNRSVGVITKEQVLNLL